MSRRFKNTLIVFLSLSVLTFGVWYQVNQDKEKEPENGVTIINPPGDIHELLAIGDTIIAAGKNGLFLLDANSKTLISHITDEQPIYYVKDIEFFNGKIFIAYNEGVAIWDFESFVFYSEEDGLPDKRVNALLINNDGELLAGTWKGIVMFDGDGFVEHPVNSVIEEKMVNVMMQTPDNTYWIGSYTAPRGGLSIVKGEELSFFDKESGLPHNNVTCLALDSNNQIWAGLGLYKSGGASVFSTTDGEVELERNLSKEADGLAGEKVRSLFMMNEAVFLGSEYDGMAILGRDSVFILNTQNYLCHDEVKCMITDGNGNFWVSSRDGITVIDKKLIDELVTGDSGK